MDFKESSWEKGLVNSWTDHAKTERPAAEHTASSSIGRDSDVHSRSGSLSPWPARKQVEAEEQAEVYITPLTPRRQDRRASKREANDIIRGPRKSEDVSREHDGIYISKQRSASFDDIFAADGLDLPKGYRRMERLLEEQNRRQQQLQEQMQLLRYSMDDSRPSPSPIVALIDAGPNRNRSSAASLQPGIPRRSSSRGRSRRTTIEIEGEVPKVILRDRATSEPLNALKVAEDLARQEAQQEDVVFRPVRTRPLSLPSSNQQPPSSLTARHDSITGFSTENDPNSDARIAAGDNGVIASNKVSYDDGAYRGLSTSTRPSLSFILHNRAQARYHLNALSAMRPRLPDVAELDYLLCKSWLPRLHHAFLFIISYFCVLITIFFDYNVLFSTIQVANSASSGVSTAWWIASGLYALSFLIWLIGVVILWEYLIQYRRRWATSTPPALPIYLSSSAFTLTSIRSFPYYSLLYRARFSAQRRDFIIETLWFYSQNWPTALTLLPRGIILTVFLVIYNPYTGTGNMPANGQNRDTTYFDPSTGLLKTFSLGILIANAAWMAWRLLILLVAYLGLFFTLGFRGVFEREKRSFDYADGDNTATKKSREALGQRPFSSTLIHQPLLEQGVEDHRYSSLEAQIYLRELAETSLNGPQQQHQGCQDATRRRPASFDVQLPHWAWKARAEERLLALLLEGSHLEPNSNHRLIPSSRESSGENQRLALGIDPEPEMQGIDSARASHFQAGPSTHAAIYSEDNLELTALRPPILNRRRSGEDRPSYSSDVRRSVEFAAAPTIPLAIGAISDGSPSRSRISLQQQRRSGEKKSRLSSSSELSLARTSMDSRYNGDQTVESDSGRATVGQKSHLLAVADAADPSLIERGKEVGAVISPVVASTSGMNRKQRASSSLSSLSESLRFMRSNKSVDKIEDPSLAKETKNDTTWWSSVIKRGSKDQKTYEEQQGTKAEPEAGVTGEAKEGERAVAVRKEEVEESASLKSNESSSTEDSEEKRIWSQFPEQSRKFPPGLIALELEQKRLSFEEDRRLSGEEFSGLSTATREEAMVLTNGGETPRPEGLRPIEEESYNSHSHTSHDN